MSSPSALVLGVGVGLLLAQPLLALSAVLGAWLADRAWRS